MNIQILLLAIVALMGIPAGFILKYFTEEEMKPGKKWFRMISALSVLAFLGSMIFVSGDNLALMLTTFSFIFFISTVPLFKFKKK